MANRTVARNVTAKAFQMFADTRGKDTFSIQEIGMFY